MAAKIARFFRQKRGGIRRRARRIPFTQKKWRKRLKTDEKYVILNNAKIYCVFILVITRIKQKGKTMKKGFIATLLSIVMLFSACNVLPQMGGSFNGGESEHSGSVEDSSDLIDDSSDSVDDSSDESSDDSETDDVEHVDEDDNGFCDECKESVTLTLDIFSINDLHGKFADTDAQAGVDELSTYIKNAKAKNENTLFLASGDMWQGAPESNLTKGRILTEWMNEMGCVSMTLGNHEYDWGEEYIQANFEMAEFPFLAINIFERATNERVDYCSPSVMVETGGAKIGIIGAIGDCYSSISADKATDIYFKTGSELTKLVKAESLKLKSQGADYIIYSLHDGYGDSFSQPTEISGNLGYYDTSLSGEYVDLVLEGHTHQSYVLKDSKGVYHLQGGGDNDGVSHAEIVINYANEKSIVKQVRFVSSNEYDHLADDPIVDTLMKKYEEEIALAEKVLGKNDSYRSSTFLRNLVAKLYYQAGAQKWGKEYDIVLGGGFISVRSPYYLTAGMVKYGDLQNLFPFDNSLVLCSISGYYLRKQFLETTNSNYYIYLSDYGKSVQNYIQSNKTYYIVIDTYSSSYSPNHATEIARYDNKTYARDLLAAYIEQGGLTSGK